jgi:CelD/BcsL family acetyltransferase involved in cellulose biosynthesis
MSLRIELIQDVSRFGALAREWDDLLVSSGADSLALTHHWLSTWWSVFHDGRELCVLLARDEENRLVGAAPLCRRAVLHRGLLPFSRLELLASGEDEADEIDSDYLDVILAPGHERAALERLLRWLVDEAPFDWHELLLPTMRESSVTPWLCQQLAPSLGLRRPALVHRAGVILPLPPGVEDLRRGDLHDVMKDVRRRRRRLEEKGVARLFWTTTREEYERYWPALVALHQERWQGAGRPGVFASEKFLRFHERIGVELAATGAARLAVIELDGRPVALRHLFVHAGVVHGYQAAWDVHLDRHLGLGKILTGWVLEAAVGEGLTAYDFLKGVTPYKRHWSKHTHYQVDVRMERPSVRARVRTVMEAGLDVARRIRDRRGGTA